MTAVSLCVMKLVATVVCALLFTATADCATRDEVEVWKKGFPTVGVCTSFGLRQMVSLYEVEVMQTTSANIYSHNAKASSAGGKRYRRSFAAGAVRQGSDRSRGKREKNWLVNHFLPFVRKMG